MEEMTRKYRDQEIIYQTNQQRNWTEVFKTTPQFYYYFNHQDSTIYFPVSLKIVAIESEQLSTEERTVGDMECNIQDQIVMLYYDI